MPLQPCCTSRAALPMSQRAAATLLSAQQAWQERRWALSQAQQGRHWLLGACQMPWRKMLSWLSGRTRMQTRGQKQTRSMWLGTQG